MTKGRLGQRIGPDQTRSRSVKDVAVLGSSRNRWFQLTSPSADVFQGSVQDLYAVQGSSCAMTHILQIPRKCFNSSILAVAVS